MTKYITKNKSVYEKVNSKWKRNGKPIDGDAYYVANDVLKDVLEDHELRKGSTLDQMTKERLVSDLKEEGLGIDYRIIFFLKRKDKYVLGFSSLVEKVE